MKLARVIRTGGRWGVDEPRSTINQPTAGTIVQYERDSRNLYSVYFPGVQGYAPMYGWVFDRYFEDLDDETS